MALLHFLINWLASAGDSPPDTNQGKEFKEEAVRLLATSGKTAKELGRELGVTGMSLANWRDQAIF
ncbi:MAG: transposase, partial [Limisphaerales bacterium]